MPVGNGLFRIPCFNGLRIPLTAIVQKQAAALKKPNLTDSESLENLTET